MSAPPSAYQLQTVVSLAMQTVETLRTEHGQVIDTDTELLDALAGEGVNVDDIIRRLARGALDAKANAAAAEARMEDLKARRDRFRRHEAQYRSTVQEVMQALELRSFKDAEFTLSLHDGRPKVIVIDEAALADEYVTIVTTRTPNKAAIMAALDVGDVAGVAGALKSNGGRTLTVKSR